MWEYSKIKGGYVRSQPLNSYDQFIYTILTDEKCRSRWHKLVERVWCRVMRHENSGIVIEKGYHKKFGTFKIEMCKNCYAGIIFCERKTEL